MDNILFQQILGENISMLFGDKDVITTNLFTEKVLEKIDNLDIFDWDYEDAKLNNTSHGITTFLDKGHTDIKMYGLSGYMGNTKYIQLIFSHELWHALMANFNYLYGKYFERKIDYKGIMYKVNCYSGFFNCSDGDFAFTPGYYMNESLIQLLSLAVVKKRNETDFVIDDLFKYEINDDVLNSPIDDLLSFFQLFVSAFSLSCDNWMEKNYLNNKGILESSVTSEKYKILPNNIFISESIRNPIAIMDEFDKYEGSGSYINLLSKIDGLYREYLESGVINTKEFIKISRYLKDFVNRRLYDYLDKGLISNSEYTILISEFDEQYNCFMKELKVYKITNVRTKFKKIVKNLVKMRIK